MPEDTFNLAIIGHGFVGKAIDECFPKTNKFIIDIDSKNQIKDLVDINPNIIFICLPTPMNDDGSINSKIIESVFIEIKKNGIDCINVLKSTVTPDVLQKLSQHTSRFVYNPEFLRENTATDDLINSQINILAGNRNDCLEVQNIFINFSIKKNLNFKITDIETASIIKYTINAFLASKVLFFNQIKEIFDNQNFKGSWDDFLNLICLDTRIGESHINVPGPDGKKGFGGACFPKDIAALINYASNINVDLSILKEIQEKNNNIRSEYKKSNREAEQNIKFTN
jgi:UDPglucose 6-dehydrogenase